ncbi:MAG TPA: type II toxin-antitoxin system RelE/ParE family toxin [Pirellulales bacterium]
MPRALYLPEAREDLFGIWRYIFEQSQSVDIADRFIDRIDEKAQLYCSQPLTGEPRPDLAEQVRSFLVESYVIFYVPSSEGIEVVQVIHGSRDIPKQFRRLP